MDLRYHGAAIDYRTYESGPPSGVCECTDSICRCTVIHHAEVEKDIAYDHLAEIWKPVTVSERYGAQRIVALADLHPHDFRVTINGGYYGDEVTSIHLASERAQELDGQWWAYQQLTPAEQIPHLLEMEYGHLLETLQGKTFEATTVPVNDLVYGPFGHYQGKPNMERISYYQQIQERTPRPTPTKPAVPLGIIIPDSEGYRIVDGYHRLQAAARNNRRSVPVWVAR